MKDIDSKSYGNGWIFSFFSMVLYDICSQRTHVIKYFFLINK